MSWSLSLYGHTENAEEELHIVENIRAFVETSGATGGSLSTQHNGQFSFPVATMTNDELQEVADKTSEGMG